MMPAGRPTDYREGYCDDLIEHMSSGLSFESFAGWCGCHVDTLYEWEKRHPEFSDAKKTAFEQNRLFWDRVAVDSLHDTTEYNEDGKPVSRKSPNATMIIFNLKNRFPKQWRDRTEVDQTTQHSGTIAHTVEYVNDWRDDVPSSK